VSIRGYPVTFALLAVNLGMLLLAGLRSGHPGGLLAPEPYQLCRLGGLNSPAVLGHGQYWRLLAAIALHVSVLHLALNAYGLLLLGPALEMALGWWRFLAVYVGAGMAGAAASLAVYHPRLGVGASGAIFGIGAALVVVFYHYRVGIGASVWIYVATIVTVSLILSALHVGVDNAAHVGGLLAGLAAGGLLIWRRHPAVTALGLSLPFVAAAALVLIAAASYTPGPAGEPTCLDTLFL
jgi:rhomboid protease GluP